MLRENLEEQLAKIGWRIANSHNGLNDFIVNDLGEETSFVVTKDNQLEVRKNLFGGESSLGKGSIRIELDKLNVRSGGNFNDGVIDWVSIDLGGGDNNFILFIKAKDNPAISTNTTTP